MKICISPCRSFVDSISFNHWKSFWALDDQYYVPETKYNELEGSDIAIFYDKQGNIRVVPNSYLGWSRKADNKLEKDIKTIIEDFIANRFVDFL